MRKRACNAYMDIQCMKRECMYACTDYDLLIMYKCVKFCEINIHSFIDSKLFTLQKNLTRVHLWGTFASHWRRVARVGYCGLSIKINAGIWLFGNTDTPWQWGVHWMETQFLAIFLLFKKEPRHRYSITVQPCTEIFVLHVYKFWVTNPCERRSYVSLKSENI